LRTKEAQNRGETEMDAKLKTEIDKAEAQYNEAFRLANKARHELERLEKHEASSHVLYITLLKTAANLK
jgi:hypothetical protein